MALPSQARFVLDAPAAKGAPAQDKVAAADRTCALP